MWKCKNPRGTTGTVYQVWRRIGGGAFDSIGTTGIKHFTDPTLPEGSTGVTYGVQAVTSTQHGPSGQFNPNVGLSAPTMALRMAG
ncbi:MAG: hypothetical protein ACTHLZ_05070 [Tepidisphaeraceae bacterium]